MPLSPATSQRAAVLAREVYQRPRDWLLRHDDNTTWLAIEGTDCAVDWRRNFEFVFTASDTHAGFANYPTRLMAEMLAVASHFPPGPSWWSLATALVVRWRRSSRPSCSSTSPS